MPDTVEEAERLEIDLLASLREGPLAPDLVVASLSLPQAARASAAATMPSTLAFGFLVLISAPVSQWTRSGSTRSRMKAR